MRKIILKVWLSFVEILSFPSRSITGLVLNKSAVYKQFCKVYFILDMFLLLIDIIISIYILSIN